MSHGNYPDDIRQYDNVPGSPFYRDAEEDISEMGDDELEWAASFVFTDEIRGIREAQRAERYLAMLRAEKEARGLS